MAKLEKKTKQATKKTSKKTEAISMDDLLKNYSWHGLKKGEVVEGIITVKSNKAIWVDIGAKTEGLILTKEMKVAKDFVSNFKVGDKIKVSIFQSENENGYPLLSFRKTLNDFIWNEF